MTNPLIDLSKQIAATVETASAIVVGVHPHPRVPASGVHWSPGVVVSVAHVLKQQRSASITLPDGSSVEAELAGFDTATDLAAYRVAQLTRDTATKSRHESLRPGDLTLAIGRSPRSGVTVSMGVISSVSGPWRTWQGGALDARLQLDTALYPGVNGGAVIDSEGRVIGIATAAFSRLGSMAIPVSTVDRVLSSLLTSGYVARGFLGVALRAVPWPPAMAELLLAPAKTALVVLTVEPESPAEKAGLLVGDVLVGLDGVATADPDDVQSRLGPDSVGRTLAASIVRGGKRIQVNVEISERNKD